MMRRRYNPYIQNYLNINYLCNVIFYIFNFENNICGSTFAPLPVEHTQLA